MADRLIDLLVVGGGITGAAIARDAAGRGLTVVLCEQDDLASGASGLGSGLLAAGAEAIAAGGTWPRHGARERAILLRAAPHLVQPVPCIIARRPGLGSSALGWLGLRLAEALGQRPGLPATTWIEPRRLDETGLLQPARRRALICGDCLADDARLVIAQVQDAAARGATILTRTRCTYAERAEGVWRVEFAASQGQPFGLLHARALVNATGAAAAEFTSQRLGLPPLPLRLIQRSWLVVPRLHGPDQAFLLPRRGQRPLAILPYGRHWSLLGPLETDFIGDAAQAVVGPDQVDALLAALAEWLSVPLAPAHVLWAQAAVHAVPAADGPGISGGADEGFVQLEDGGAAAPLLTVLAGPLAGHRRLAERALALLQPRLRFTKGAWTAGTILPGGEIEQGDLAAHVAYVQRRWPWLGAALIDRFAHTYGGRLEQLLGQASRPEELGEAFGDGVFEAEVDYLLRAEFAQTEADILWRRTKLGLAISERTAQRLRSWLTRHGSHAVRSAAIAS